VLALSRPCQMQLAVAKSRLHDKWLDGSPFGYILAGAIPFLSVPRYLLVSLLEGARPTLQTDSGKLFITYPRASGYWALRSHWRGGEAGRMICL
jgi:hypothetical protein